MASPASRYEPGDDFESLETGDRLSRAEFERRYKRKPRVKKAELIEGVVFMPSPVRVRRHGYPHVNLIAWLAVVFACSIT